MSAVVVLLYIALGGLTSAIYNEVLQFFLIVFGFTPVVYLGLRDAGGWQGLAARVPETFAHSWTYLGRADANPMGVEWFGMVMGLGFVLSFGYWCTDFLVVQRAMAADSMNAARRTPLIAAVPKMLFPFLVIVPGHHRAGPHAAPEPGYGAAAADARRRNLRLQHGAAADDVALLPGGSARPRPDGAAGELHVGDGRQRHRVQHRVDVRHLPELHPAAPERRALSLDGPDGDGRSASLVSIATAYAAMRFNNIMDMLQLVFSFVNAPLFATFLLGMFWKRTTGHGAFWGLVAGTGAAALHYELTGRERSLVASAEDRRAAFVSVGHGAELLGRDRRVDDLLRSHGTISLADVAETGRATWRAGVWTHRSRLRVTSGVAPASGRRDRRARAARWP